MRLSLKRTLAGVTGLAAAATLVPLAMATPAAAAPNLAGPADISPNSSSDSTAPFSITLPAGASCDGDSANDGYRVTSYMVPSSVDPATLTFDSTGPQPAGFGASFRQPLFDTTGSPYTTAQTANASPPPGPGPIINIPQFDFALFDPGAGAEIPPGTYNVGIACVIASGTTYPIEDFWNTQITVSSNPADPGAAGISWVEGAPVNQPPTGVAATPGDGECDVTFTAVAGATSYTATATPGGATATGASSPLTVTGLTNGTTYSITVTASNAAGTGPASSPAVECTPQPVFPNVTNVAVTPGAPGSGQALVTWTEPSGSPVSYTVDIAGPTATINTVPAPASSLALTGLAAGDYTATVTANFAGGFVGTNPPSAPVAFIAEAEPPDVVVFQDIDVNRPVGALVLTQVCGSNGALPADPASPGFPGGLPAVVAANSSTVEAPTAGGTAPTLTEDGTDSDSNRAEYPYPVDEATFVANPTYPTHCGIDLGIARFVTRGPAAGRFFSASGVLNQITVVDTRDDDLGWAVTGTMGRFEANGGTDSFSGSQLGWIPQMTEDTPAFTDSDGNTYNQTVTAGGVVAPNTANATGLSSGRTLASSAADNGLGTAILDARLKLLIPVTADAGDYEGTLTITAS